MRFLLITALFCLSFATNAQDFEIPDGVAYETESDYAAQNANVVAAANYLLETPINRKPKKRKMVQNYLMEWLTGTPTVSLALSQEVAPFLECGECLMAYMASYAKHAIEQPEGNAKEWNYAAIKDVIGMYEANDGATGKVKSLEKFAKLEAKGKLEAKIHAATVE